MRIYGYSNHQIQSVIKGIETLVKAQQERGRFDRWFSAHDDDGRAKQLSQQLQRELDFFAVGSCLSRGYIWD